MSYGYPPSPGLPSIGRVKKMLHQALVKKVNPPHSQTYAEQVALYTAAMLRELDANMYKGSYQKADVDTLLLEIQGHLDKLRRTIQAHPKEKARILEYAADLGNLAFMVADIAGALDLETLKKREAETDYVGY